MKYLIIILVLLFCTEAQAMIVPFNFTGVDAIYENPWLNSGVEGGTWHYSDWTGYVNGPTGNGTIGFAKQFLAEEPIFIDRVLVDVEAFSDNQSEDLFDFNFFVYSGDELPKANEEITKANVSFPITPDLITYQDDFPSTSMWVTLPAGNYWLAYERGEHQAIGNLSDFKYVGHNPEPATIALLGTGLFFMRRKFER